MEYSFYDNMGLMVATILIGGGVAIYMVLRRANEWVYLTNLGEKRHSLPPGDMGWPLIGNMLSFLQAYKYGDPDSFISNLHSKYCHARIYKSFMFGSPSIILTTPEACRQALMDEEKFGPGWPASVVRVLGKRGLHGISNEEHRRQRRLTSASLSGHEAMSVYLEYIKDIVSVSLNELCDRERPIELLTEMRKIAFKIIMYIILGTENSPMLEAMEEQYTLLAHGLKAMSINLPGFAFRKALMARKKLVKVFLALVVEERAKLETINQLQTKKFMVHWLMETEDEDGRKLTDDEIVDLIIIYLLAGHESFAHASTWAIIHLHEHPQYLHKAKEEQQEILKKRLSSHNGLNLTEIKQMEYLAKVIDETFRVANISFTFFRETREEVKINGYTIPKGWKVLPWIRGVHMDPETYPNPKEFNPSRWDTSKVGARPFLPFGAGSRLCPGMNLAKLEMTVFLHYFLLYFKLERLTPGCKVAYLPITHPMDNCIAKIKKL